MAALLKEKDEIINQVMAEGEEILSLFVSSNFCRNENFS